MKNPPKQQQDDHTQDAAQLALARSLAMERFGRPPRPSTPDSDNEPLADAIQVAPAPRRAQHR